MKFNETTLLQKILIGGIHIVYIGIIGFFIRIFGFKGINISNLSSENYWFMIMFLSLLLGFIFFKKKKEIFFKKIGGKILSFLIYVLIFILLILTGAFGFEVIIIFFVAFLLYILYSEIFKSGSVNDTWKIIAKHSLIVGGFVLVILYLIFDYFSAISSMF